MDAHLPILRRLGILLLVFFGLHLASVILDGSTSHSFSIDLGSLIFGLLLLSGRVGATRWLAFFTAFNLLGLLLAPIALLAIPFFRQIVHAAGWANLIITWLIEAGVDVYILLELRRPEIDDALRAVGRGPIRRCIYWGAGVCGVSMALFVGLWVSLIRPMFDMINDKAVAAAKQQLGEGWEFQVTQFNSNNGGWRAHVIARRGSDIRELDVGDPPPQPR